jgi:cysteine desulfurase
MYVNNETGSIQPISDIAGIVKDRRLRTRAPFPLFHTDAAQALGYLDCDVEKLGVDLMTVSGQKIYGPKGISALFIRQSAREKGREFAFHPGTKNTPLIVGFGKAAELAVKERTKNAGYVGALKREFWRGLKKIYPQAEMNGDGAAPHVLNIYFPTEYAGDLLIKLDMAGVAVSAGSACSARSFTPSHVLLALGFPEERVRGSLRFSFGKTLKRKDIKTVLKRMRDVLR